MKIRQIIDKIDENQLFVPAFQREYVWKRNDAKNLISSLIKDYPTGTMLTWETNKPPELKGKFKYDENKGAVKIILDGQQRITTLYMLMQGDIPPYYNENEIENDIRNLYVNVESLELEYYKVKMMENNPLWVNITDIFKGKVRERDITDELERRNNGERLPRERETLISNNIRSIERIEDRDFLEQIIPVKATIKEAIDIFYIVNASGVNLTDAELALAQISGYWPNARDLFKKKLQELEKQGWVFKLDFIVYALLAVTHKMGSKMEKLHTADNKDKLMAAWKKLDDTVLDYVCNLLQSQAFIDHTDEINSIYALIPLISYTFNKPDSKLNEEEIKKSIKWFYYSQIRFRYISQLPQKLDKDIGIINDNLNPFDTLLALIDEERPLEIKSSEFIGRDIRHPLFSLMKWYFKSKGAVCLGTGLSLRKNMGKKYSLERDHIFAYSVLRDSGIYDMENQFHYAIAQEITNRAILTSTENREKSAMFADVYLSNVRKLFPNALKLQSIPEDENLWKVENYERFLEARRETLAKELNYFLQTISIGQVTVSTSVDLLDMIASGEHGFLEFKSTMRWNWKENRLDKKMEEIILKTISAFSNAEGGKLLIGVTDEGEILGLESDYNTFKEANKDHFELHLRNIINNAFGKEFGAIYLNVRFPIVNDIEICEIDIKAAKTPLYCEIADKNGASQKKFYIRSGNSSQELDIEETASYIKKRF
ncbi:MAG: DUF262 domain-containing protein [Saprospiraceae bacterium]|nr:DUF262 domain-containing protein [Saprospiraceae bacterium]